MDAPVPEAPAAVPDEVARVPPCSSPPTKASACTNQQYVVDGGWV